MVVQGSLARAADGVTIHFDVTDGKATVPAIFNGIAPDLFKEGSGVIAEGAFDQSGTFVASNLLAKHDERYMPRELEGMQSYEKTHKVETGTKISEEHTSELQSLMRISYAVFCLTQTSHLHITQVPSPDLSSQVLLSFTYMH